MKLDLLSRFLPSNRRAALLTASVAIVAIALGDYVTASNISVGLLYVFPILIAAGQLRRMEVALVALLCTFFREQFGPVPWSEGLAPRLVTTFLAYLGIGLLMREMDQHRRTALLQTGQLEKEIERRETVEQQLRRLIEGTPAAILVLDPDGTVLSANQAAHDLLGLEHQSLISRSIDDYLPDMARLRQTIGVRHFVRTMIEGTGYRQDGQAFLAHIWVSSYGPPSATGLTAVIFDASEELRMHEEVGLHSLTASARIIMGAFWHETRNLCSAMRVLVAALMERPGVASTPEVEGLKSLVDSLEKIAYAELHPTSEHNLDTASLREVLNQLRIVIEPSFQEQQIAIDWRLPEDLFLVRADKHGLLQVFLNLTRNASRALAESEEKRLTVAASVEDGRIKVRFHNSGPPIATPEALFKPLHSPVAERGLGLYVARAIIRSFGGDLQYEPVQSGCCFTVTLERTELWYIFRDDSRQEDSYSPD